MEAGRVKILHLASVLAVLLLALLPEVSVGLELSPSATEVILNANSSFSVVCSGWGRVTWKPPQEPALEGVRVDDRGTSSVLILDNVTARHSGNYVCEEPSSDETKDLAIFIPDPEQWFVPLGPGVVMKEGEEGTIPCVVSDPRVNVSLYERPGLSPVEGRYQPSRGFSAKLKDSSYICRGTMDGQERESTVYYVYSIIVPKSMNAFMTVSQTVVKQGDPLMVNCTVKEAEMVFFSWEYPREETIEPLTEFLSSRELRIRSFLNISSARLEDSGLYVCTVQESVQGQTAMDNLTVTVLARGYVDLDPGTLTNVSVLQYETVELMVQVEAFPTPQVTWTRGNSTLPGDTNSLETRRVHETSYLSTLTLVRVRMEQRGLYTVQVTNEDDAKEVTFNLQVTAPPRILDLSDQHVEVGHAVQCVTEGVPTPTIHWYSCSSTHRCSNQTTAWRTLTSDLLGVVVQQNVTYQEERGVEQVRSVLTMETVAAVTAVRCEARNNRGRRARDIRLVSNSLFSQVAVLAAVLALVVIAVIFLIILIALWRKKPRYDIRWKVIESVSSDGQEYTYMDPMHLPYDSVWELPRDSLVLGHTLGSGAFGRVVEATAYSLGNAQTTTKVAVKMLKSTARRSETQALISELKIMSHLGPHLNIVNLLGACTKRGPIYLVTEYCRHGDLVDYLHRSKHTFLQQQAERSGEDAQLGGGSSPENNQNTGPGPGRSESDGGYMDMTKEESLEYVAMQEQTDVIEYADIEPCVYEMPYQQDDGYQKQGPGQDRAEAVLSMSDSPVLSFTDLLGFGFQVTQGMDFLASKNCIHRDLAARNVLVCEGKLVKICDFGLARDVMNDSNYVAKGNTFLPLKWMAPESIFQNQYTILSDVWSFGILLWEIFSLGGTPYPDIPMNEQFYAALKRGYRMPKPTHATEDIYGLICKCWDEKSEKRPEFSSLVQTIGGLLSDAYRKRYDQVSENFLRSDHPAVVRTRPRTADTQDAHANPSEEVELREAGPSHSAYIIPIPDITIETSGEVLDTPTETTESPQGLDAQADGSPGDTPLPTAGEVMSAHTQEEEEPNHSPCSPEVEESFL